MRRFLNTLQGRAVCHFVVMALVLPVVTLLSIAKSQAQVVTAGRWAVVPFANRAKVTGNYGVEAAQKINDEFTKVFSNLPPDQRPDVIPPDSVTRAIETLNLAQPVTEQTSLLRLANELGATTLVTGEIVGWGVGNVTGGSQASIGIRVLVIDVASGLPINGAAVAQKSSIRGGNVTPDTLVSEALETAAVDAVSKIQTQRLPTATVLNTRVNEALINRGSRSGFKDGQEVIVTRGREQVATGTVFGTEPDSANVHLTRSFKGIEPGDKIRVVFRVPDIVLAGGATGVQTGAPGTNGQGAPPTVFHTQAPKQRTNPSSLVSTVLVLGLVAVLLSGGRSSSNNSAQGLVAQAALFPTNSGTPAVKLQWKLDPFFRNGNNVQWLIFRNDVSGAPALVQDGAKTFAYDDTNQRTFQFATPPQIQDVSGTCPGFAPGTGSANGVVPGQPYLYEISGVYRISQLDLPVTNKRNGKLRVITPGLLSTGSSSAGVGGTTAATTANTTANTTAATTAGTTAATTAGTSTGASVSTTAVGFCFFTSARTAAKGPATPLNRPVLLTPIINQVVTSNVPFTFQSVVNTAFPARIGYVVQISSSPQFPMNATVTSPEKISTEVKDQSITFPPRFSGDTFAGFLQERFGNATVIWWRAGARNIDDVPGPEPDKTTGLRYVFSAPQPFNRTASGPPGKGRGTSPPTKPDHIRTKG